LWKAAGRDGADENGEESGVVVKDRFGHWLILQNRATRALNVIGGGMRQRLLGEFICEEMHLFIFDKTGHLVLYVEVSGLFEIWRFKGHMSSF